MIDKQIAFHGKDLKELGFVVTDKCDAYLDYFRYDKRNTARVQAKVCGNAIPGKQQVTVTKLCVQNSTHSCKHAFRYTIHLQFGGVWAKNSPNLV